MEGEENSNSNIFKNTSDINPTENEDKNSTKSGTSNNYDPQLQYEDQIQQKTNEKNDITINTQNKTNTEDVETDNSTLQNNNIDSNDIESENQAEEEEEEEEEIEEIDNLPNNTVYNGNENTNQYPKSDNNDTTEEEEVEVTEEEEEEEAADEEEEEEEAAVEEEEKIDTNPKSDRSETIDEEEEIIEEDEEDGNIEDDVPQTILAHKSDNNGQTTFLVKLEKKSYRKCKWFTEDELKPTIPLQYRYYIKHHHEAPTAEPFFNPNFLIPEKIISMKKLNDKTFYLVKWKDLDYPESTWENSEECLNEYPELVDQYSQSRKLPSLDQLFIPPHPSPQSFQPITHHPGSRSGYQIRKYQLSGLNFLVNAWYNNRNAILADEMGLGKTAQAIMFLDYLDKKQEIHGPFLIVAPLSTIPHWEREINEWSSLSSITYYGGQGRRKYLKKYEMFYPQPNANIVMFQVLLTTYEYVIKAEKLFSPIKWRAIIIDEAQRMKNHQSKLFSTLSTYSSDFKLLMTGTPLQNNIEELWTLLNFLDPNAFDNLQKFQQNFGDLNEVENIVQLQTILKPMMLRRMKSEVEKSIAPLEEIIIECPMTPYQRMYYKSIFEKNIDYLHRGAHKSNSTSLRNIAMELRKVCNHPFLIAGAEDQITIEKRESLNLKENDEAPSNFEFDLLVRNSGKMILLDKLLRKLKQDGHRVLIFSQMTAMLDIIQDYLNLVDYKFCRIDGDVRSEIRQVNIDEFNKKGSDKFVFLLCTRSGGVGINLASADTVIIYDSDYNPQNDIQATSRCHRIGQKKEVKMYRFITAKSYERKMFDMASIKLGLDHAVLGSGKKEDSSKLDLEKLLRFGAYYAYKEEEDNNASETFGEEDIESVISRSTRIQHASVVGGEGSTFSKAHFEISENDTDVDLTAPDFWQKYIPVVEEDVNLDNCSIAERYRKIKERMSLEDLNEKLRSKSTPSLSSLADTKKSPKKKDKEENLWTLNKIKKLMNSILNFGWGRWNTIIENTKLTFELRRIIAAAHVILHWLIEASIESSTKPSPIMESINQKCIENDQSDDEMIELQKQFIIKYRNAFYSTITGGANWKLSRLELLYFIDTLVKSAKNLPDDIPIPPVKIIKPADWWTINDDRLLIYNTWKYGFSNYNHEEFTFSQNIAENTKRLTNRLHTLMDNLKNTYASYKTKNKDENLAYSCEVLSQALSTFLPKDHKSLIDTLTLIGNYPDIEKFKEIGNIQSKSNASVQNYIQKVIDYCKALKNNESVESFDIAEPISINKATRILNRVNFFDDLRKSKIELQKEDDQKLFNYLIENGFLNMTNELDWVKEKYELTDLTEFNLIKLVHQIRRGFRKFQKGRMRAQSSVRTRIRSTRSNSTADDIYKPDTKVYIDCPSLVRKEDGSYQYPIQITQKIKLMSLGEVVYDRPHYHTDKYIYPVGYQIEKEFYSISDPNNQAVYRASVLDGGDYPLFRVECLDKSKMVFEGNSPSKPWMEASLSIEATKKKLGMPTKDVVTISGPVAFGFPLPIVTYLIDNLPNARKCINHVFKRYAVRGDENDKEDDQNEFKNGSGEDDEEEEELNDEFDYDDNEEDENRSEDEENGEFEYDEDDEDNDDYSEEESYDDSYDGNAKKIRIKMRRIRISKKRKDFFPNLCLKFTHLDELGNNDTNKDNENNEFGVSYRSNQLIGPLPFDYQSNDNKSTEDHLKDIIVKLSEHINNNNV
ncbi:choline dehydrogenase 6 [Tritrichomonas musculus]|uniref:Choline dehydrogenase 6 n=1 Tax=Tritrichomonas musculus TaxID=1915356 RepID=A0ABR2KAJ3_9EUKA